MMNSFRASAAQQTPLGGGFAPTPDRSTTLTERTLAKWKKGLTNQGPLHVAVGPRDLDFPRKGYDTLTVNVDASPDASSAQSVRG
jgi:hypothetical protein